MTLVLLHFDRVRQLYRRLGQVCERLGQVCQTLASNDIIQGYFNIKAPHFHSYIFGIIHHHAAIKFFRDHYL